VNPTLHHYAMTDEHTEDRTPDTGATSRPAGSSNDATSRDWIIPVSVLGGLLVAAIVFVAGFGVGRATADDDDAYEARHAIVVPINPGDRAPRGDGYGFGGFGQRGPRFGGDPGELRELPGFALDRACTLLDEGAIPGQAPFIDRLTELCDARGT
jgi:hypothetical protein